MGWLAYRSVPSGRRPEILRALTLALLADVPEDQVTALLRRRVEEDPDDLDAQVALLRKSLDAETIPPDRPRIGHGSARRSEALTSLEAILKQAPDHQGAREAVVDALLDAGRIDEARPLLLSWPDERRDDPKRLRLQARIDLDFDARPDQAAESLQQLLVLTPHDWQLRARLSRALEMQGDREGARRQALLVDLLREQLAPDRLGRRLAEAFARLDDPDSLEDLAELCASVGLADLAAAWRFEAAERSSRKPASGRLPEATDAPDLPEASQP